MSVQHKQEQQHKRRELRPVRRSANRDNKEGESSRHRQQGDSESQKTVILVSPIQARSLKRKDIQRLQYSIANMSDAKARFFARMNNDFEDSERSNGGPSNIDIDFSFTESGRTVAHMITETSRSIDDMMDFSVTQSTRSTTGDGGGNLSTGGFTESERDELVKMFGPGSNGMDGLLAAPTKGSNAMPNGTATRSIPVPRVSNQNQQPTTSLLSQNGGQSSNPGSLLPNHQPGGSSYDSSNSAFLSSVLNPQGATPSYSTGLQTPLSHTPPAASSYEASHFGKRARSGSVSSRLRSASDYFEQKGLLDRQTKGILKDLVIIGDEEMEQALRRYEAGDPTVLEEMIRSGALQNRLPKDLDLLGDLDFDFLNMQDTEMDLGGQSNPGMEMLPGSSAQSQPIPMPQYGAYGQSMAQSGNDDGIGDLDFTGDFAMDQHHPRSYGSSRQPSAAASPTEISEYERRMRSNSLFTALMNEPHSHDLTNAAPIIQGEWVQTGTPPLVSQPQTVAQGGIKIRGPTVPQQNGQQARQIPRQQSGITASLEAEKKRQEKEAKREKKEQRKAERERKAQEKRKEEAEMEEHVPGSGKPYPLDDPQLKITTDEHGLRHVERPDGWVGAYSPESRKARIERFMEKRNHRVWTKSVKYDVRKNFADSRLRVKGRFVKKEDELLMRVSQQEKPNSSPATPLWRFSLVPSSPSLSNNRNS